MDAMNNNMENDNMNDNMENDITDKGKSSNGCLDTPDLDHLFHLTKKQSQASTTVVVVATITIYC
jgi:hypothetical protein